jgi:hypothetical protein
VAQLIADLSGVVTRASIPASASSASQGHPRVWEMTWAYDGRATFQYGEEVHPGQPHIIWRRVGTHAIFGRP